MQRLFLLIVFLSTICIPVFTQKITKLLSNEEVTKLHNGEVIIKRIDSLNRDIYGGLTGDIKIQKIGRRNCQKMIGIWICENYKNKSDAIMSFDSSGNLQCYKEYNKQKVIVFDCVYHYEITKNVIYRIENMIIRYDSGKDFIHGYRYRIIKPNYGRCGSVSRQKKIGVWEYYSEQGQLMVKKDFGNIE